MGALGGMVLQGPFGTTPADNHKLISSFLPVKNESNAVKFKKERKTGAIRETMTEKNCGEGHFHRHLRHIGGESKVSNRGHEGKKRVGTGCPRFAKNPWGKSGAAVPLQRKYN